MSATPYKSAGLAAAVCLAFASAAWAQSPSGERGRSTGSADQRPAAPPTSPPALPPDSVTKHTLNFSDRTVSFTATAGAIRLSDAESGAPRADVAYIAYRLADADPKTRPVAFVFNGGPGYASAWLDLGALGPWRLPLTGDADRPSAPAVAIDNPDTWLDFADLVFLDPPGTGYSRVLGGDDVRKSLWSVEGDANALATTIRRWSEANNRMLSPKFIVGESYGGFRAPKIAHILQTDQGVGIDGIVMISPVLSFSRWQGADSVMGLVARLPGMAATWRERQLLAAKPPRPLTRAEMKEVEDYASGAFLADLMKGPDDAAAVGRLSAKVSELTGLDPALTRRFGGRVPNDVFAREINRADRTVSSMYDGNATALDPAPFAEGNSADDALLRGLHAPMVQAMVDIYHNRLNWTVENGRYQFANNEAGRQWDYGRRPPSVINDLQEALALDPSMRALVAHGFADLVTPYYESKLELDQVPHTGNPDRLRLRVYPGGHMMYTRDASRRALREDARALVEGR